MNSEDSNSDYVNRLQHSMHKTTSRKEAGQLRDGILKGRLPDLLGTAEKTWDGPERRADLRTRNRVSLGFIKRSEARVQLDDLELPYVDDPEAFYNNGE